MRPEGAEEMLPENDDWVKARLLLDTVEAHELLDPQLTPRSCSTASITRTA